MSIQVLQARDFGPFRIDSARRLLYRDGAIVDIPPKAFAVLLVLIERRGQVIGKQELMDAVWPNVAVEENNLARSISTLRKALGEKSGEHRYILTVPGSGYSFVGADDAAEEINGAIPGERRGFRSRVAGTRHGLADGFGPLAVLCIAVLLWVSGSTRAVDRFETVRFKRIFTTQRFPQAGLSPDGKHLVYAAGERGQESVRLRRIESGSEVELLAGSNRSYSGFTFTPDGRHICLLEKAPSDPTNILVTIPASGCSNTQNCGPGKEVARELDSPPSVSPDGSQVAFVRETQSSESLLIRRSLIDGQESRLAVAKFPTFFDYPVWSPDGRSIAYTEVTPDGASLQEIAVESRRSRRIGSRWRHIRRFAWRPRGDGFLVSAIEPRSDSYTIWQVARGDGSAKRITENVDSLHNVILSPDGTRALTVAERSLSALWIGTPGTQEADQGAWRQLLPPSENVAAISWAEDGQILLERKSANGRSVHLVSQDGKEQEELLAPGPYHNVDLCPDKRRVVYYSTRPEGSGLWVTDLRASRSSRLVALSAETFAECLPDQRSLWFVSQDPQWWPGLWSMPIDGGNPKRIRERFGTRYAISSDGRWAAYFDHQGVVSPQRKATQIVVDSLEGKEPPRRFNVAPTVATNVPLRWMPGDAMITYADGGSGIAEIWGQPVTGGEPRQITSLSGGLISSFDWSPDGKKLVLSRGMRSFDLLLLELDR